MAALVAVAATAGCGSQNDPDIPAHVVTSTAASTPTGIPDLSAAEEIARGIDVPWGLAFLPAGDALISERDTGRILRLAATGDY